MPDNVPDRDRSIQLAMSIAALLTAGTRALRDLSVQEGRIRTMSKMTPEQRKALDALHHSINMIDGATRTAIAAAGLLNASGIIGAPALRSLCDIQSTTLELAPVVATEFKAAIVERAA